MKLSHSFIATLIAVNSFTETSASGSLRGLASRRKGEPSQLEFWSRRDLCFSFNSEREGARLIADDCRFAPEFFYTDDNQLQLENTQLCLEADGRNIRLERCNDRDDKQQWSFIKTIFRRETYYRIQNEDKGDFIELDQRKTVRLARGDERDEKQFIEEPDRGFFLESRKLAEDDRTDDSRRSKKSDDSWDDEDHDEKKHEDDSRDHKDSRDSDDEGHVERLQDFDDKKDSDDSRDWKSDDRDDHSDDDSDDHTDDDSKDRDDSRDRKDSRDSDDDDEGEPSKIEFKLGNDLCFSFDNVREGEELIADDCDDAPEFVLNEDNLLQVDGEDLCLEADGSKIKLEECDEDDDKQQWIFIRIRYNGDDFYKIKNVETGDVIELDGRKVKLDRRDDDEEKQLIKELDNDFFP